MRDPQEQQEIARTPVGEGAAGRSQGTGMGNGRNWEHLELGASGVKPTAPLTWGSPFSEAKACRSSSAWFTDFSSCSAASTASSADPQASRSGFCGARTVTERSPGSPRPTGPQPQPPPTTAHLDVLQEDAAPAARLEAQEPLGVLPLLPRLLQEKLRHPRQGHVVPVEVKPLREGGEVRRSPPGPPQIPLIPPSQAAQPPLQQRGGMNWVLGQRKGRGPPNPGRPEPPTMER